MTFEEWYATTGIDLGTDFRGLAEPAFAAGRADERERLACMLEGYGRRLGPIWTAEEIAERIRKAKP